MDNTDNINEIILSEVNEHEECVSRGICSINSHISSVNELIIIYLTELSFYLLKLKDFGITNEKIKEIIIYVFFNILTGAEYNQEQFDCLISNLYTYINQSKFLYEKYCTEHSMDIEKHKIYFKYRKRFSLPDAIKKGEKYFLKKIKKVKH